MSEGTTYVVLVHSQAQEIEVVADKDCAEQQRKCQ